MAQWRAFFAPDGMDSADLRFICRLRTLFSFQTNNQQL